MSDAVAHWLGRDQASIWHPFTQMAAYADELPLIVARAEGNHLYDVEGNRYFDAISSLWCNVHGHRVPEIDQAIINQLGRVAHSTLLGHSNTMSIEAAEAILKLAPPHYSRVFFSDNGSSATEIALKMAYQYCQLTGQTQRRSFIGLTDAYHGDTLGAVSAGGISLFHDRFGDLLFNVHRLRAPHPYRWPTSNCLEDAKAEAKALFESIGHTVAALIIEPRMQGAAGMLRHPDGYLEYIQGLCREHGVLLICDEVATGFGRTGSLFASDLPGVQPDLMCVAKGITGGYLPLAATLVTPAIYEAFLGQFGDMKHFFHGHTYTGNALACAAVVASASLFESRQVMSHVRATSAALDLQLKQSLSDVPVVGDIRKLGLMVGIELVDSNQAPHPSEQRRALKVCQRLKTRGILMRPLGNVLVLMPPLSSTVGELEYCVTSMRAALDDEFGP